MSVNFLKWPVVFCVLLAALGACSRDTHTAGRAVGVIAKPPPVKRLTRSILDQSLALGRRYMLDHQDRLGGFDYEYDFVRRRYSAADSQVRQAGALWGLAMIHRDSPSPETAQAVAKGLDFFRCYSKDTRGGLRYTTYLGASKGATGAVALVILTLIEFLGTDDDLPRRGEYESDLKQYIRFLLSVRMENGHFHRCYRLADGKGYGAPSPYFDGEALLALAKAAKAKLYDDPQLERIVMESAEAMYRRNVVEALRKDPDSAVTKGFYQWSSMAYYEIYTAGWEGADPYAGRVINLGHWMIDTHKVLRRRRNTGYAFEGLTTAWEVARLTGDRPAMDKFAKVIDAGLYKLTSWQVGSPIANDFLKRQEGIPAEAGGGIMNGRAEPRLRIDVLQHQMHAVLLARRYLYP